LTDIVIDNSDASDRNGIKKPRIHNTDTRMPDLAASTRLAQNIVDTIAAGE
jgi:hypothetical protein